MQQVMQHKANGQTFEHWVPPEIIGDMQVALHRVLQFQKAESFSWTVPDPANPNGEPIVKTIELEPGDVLI